MKYSQMIVVLGLFWASLAVAAGQPHLVKSKYKGRDFEFKCMVREAIEPGDQRICPLVSKYSFDEGFLLEDIQAYLQQKLSVRLTTDEFFKAKALFIDDLQKRQRQMGIGEEFIAGYSPYFTELYESLTDAGVLHDELGNYLIFVSVEDQELYLIEGAGVL